MKNTLNQLKQTKGIRREFPFIKTLRSYAEEHYGEIADVLDPSNIKEIVREIESGLKEKGINEGMCVYKNLNELLFYRHGLDVRVNRKYDEATEEYLNGIYSSKVGIDWDNYQKTDKIFYIADVEGYQAYLEEERQIKKAKELKEKQEKVDAEVKAELDKQATIKEDVEIRKEFGLKAKDSTETARLFKQLFQEEKLETRYNAFSKLIGNKEIIDENYIREIASEEANAVMETHEWDEH